MVDGGKGGGQRTKYSIFPQSIFSTLHVLSTTNLFLQLHLRSKKCWRWVMVKKRRMEGETRAEEKDEDILVVPVVQIEMEQGIWIMEGVFLSVRQRLSLQLRDSLARPRWVNWDITRSKASSQGIKICSVGCSQLTIRENRKISSVLFFWLQSIDDQGDP